MIYHWNGQEWKKCKPVLIHCTYMAYSLHWKQHTEFDPQLLPPATPSIDSSQTFLIIQLPICAVCTIPSTMPRAPFNQLERLCILPLEWALPLWHHIWPMAPIDSMAAPTDTTTKTPHYQQQCQCGCSQAQLLHLVNPQCHHPLAW